MSVLPLWFILPFLFLFGACLGSFAGMLAYRLPRGLPWWRVYGEGARSCCPSCRRVLSVAELIPILSWFLLKGRCKGCGQPIAFRYVLIELSFALIVLFAGLVILD